MDKEIEYCGMCIKWGKCNNAWSANDPPCGDYEAPHKLSSIKPIKSQKTIISYPFKVSRWNKFWLKLLFNIEVDDDE